MTEFQLYGRDTCLKWAEAHRMELAFHEVERAHDRYYVGEVRRPRHKAEIYIYEDEAGVMLEGEQWHPFEAPDYGTGAELINALLSFLEEVE